MLKQFALAVMPYFHPDGVKVHDGVNIVQETVLPQLDLFQYRFGNLGDQGGGYINPIHLLQMPLDVTCGHSAGIHGDDLVVETGKAAFPLGKNHRLKAAVTVTGNANIEIAEFPFNLLLVAAVTGVAAIFTGWLMLFVTEMFSHLGLHGALKTVL